MLLSLVVVVLSVSESVSVSVCAWGSFSICFYEVMRVPQVILHNVKLVCPC